MARRRIRWPATIAALVLATATVLLLLNPEVLAPAATRLINRQLENTVGGHLRVGNYKVRPFAGIDATEVTLTLRGDRGGLTLVAADTVEIDFRLREVLGRTVRLRRFAARGVEIYRSEGLASVARPFAAPRLEIDLADIRDVQAELSTNDGRLRERVRNLSWRGEVSSDGDQLRLVARSGGLDWETRATRFSQLYGSAAIGPLGVDVEELGVGWNDGRASVRGTIGRNGDLDLICNGRGVSAAEFTELTGVALDFEAAGDIICHVVTRNDSLFFDADFTGRFADWDLDDVRAESVIAGDEADFSTIRGGVGGGWFDGRLHVDARDEEDVVISVVGEGRDLDLRAGLIPGDPSELPRTGGHGRVEVIHHTADLSTVVRADLVDGEVEIMPFDSCHVEVWAREDSLQFREVDLRHGSLRARLAGSSDRREIFRGYLRFDAADLRDLPAGWEWPTVTGAAGGQVAVTGPLDSLGIAGRLDLHDVVLGPVDFGSGVADVVGDRVLGTDWTLSTAVRGEGFALRGVGMGEYLAWTRITPTSVALDSFRTVLGDTVTTVRGRADLQPGRADLDVRSLGVDLAGAHWRIDEPVAASVGQGLFDLTRIHLLSEQGDLLASIRYSDADSLLDVTARLENFDLNLLDPLLRQQLRTGGRATAEITVGGRLGAAEMSVEGSLTGARFPLARVDSLTVTASLRGGVVAIDDLDLVTEFGHLGLQGTIAHPGHRARDFWPDAELDLTLAISDGDWSFVDQFELEALAAIAGKVDGDLAITGTTRDPLITGTLDSGPFHYQWLHLERLTGTVRVEHDQMALGNLEGRQGELRLLGRLEIPMQFDLLSEPITPEDGPFYGRLTLPPDSDLTPLRDATDAFTRISGRGSGEIIVSGPLIRPRYQGEIEISDASFVLRGNEEIFADVFAQGVFANDLLIIQGIRGREGLKGTFDGAGVVTFDGLALKTWDITFQADRLLIATIPDLRVLVRTQNGRLTGVPVGPDSTLVPRFTGDYEVIKGRYTGTFANSAGGADPTLGNIFPDWLADLRVIGPPRSLRIANRTMELDLSGDVNLVRTADGMLLAGSMTIDKGRLPVFHNTFEVVRGRLDFSREVGVEPTVDIDAETRVRVRSPGASTSVVERLTVHATGPVNAMEISFSSESGYPRAAIERMLLGLAPYPDEQADQGALTNASIGAGLNLIEREIAQGVSNIFDTVEIDQIQRQQAGTPGIDPLIGVGKYVGSDLYIKYAQGLNQNDRDIVVEYQVSNHLLLQTEIRRRIDEYQGDASYNLDFKYRFEY